MRLKSKGDYGNSGISLNRHPQTKKTFSNEKNNRMASSDNFILWAVRGYVADKWTYRGYSGVWDYVCHPGYSAFDSLSYTQ